MPLVWGVLLKINLFADLQITKQPQENSIINCDDCAAMHVSAVGSGHLSYKWKKNGEDITDPNFTGIDTHTLNISCFSSKFQGEYICKVKDDHKTIKSNPAKLELSKCTVYLICNT